MKVDWLRQCSLQAAVMLSGLPNAKVHAEAVAEVQYRASRSAA